MGLTMKDPSITTRAPKVSVITHDRNLYVGWLIGNSPDGGVELEWKNGTRRTVARDRIAKVTYWKDNSA